MTGGSRTRAMDVYQVATSWLMMLAWPMYFAWRCSRRCSCGCSATST